jgi:hypothetical protein
VTIRDNYGYGHEYGIDSGSTNASTRHFFDNRWVSSVQAWDVQLNAVTLLTGDLPAVTLAGNAITWSPVASSPVSSQSSATASVTIAQGGLSSGARAGDHVVLGPPSTWPSGLLLTGYVSANNVVTLVATNGSGSSQTIPHASGDTYTVRVMKPGS